MLSGPAPAGDDAGEWQTLLCNLDLMTVSAGQTVATIDGMLLFGKNPKRFVPQSGIRAVCYPGTRPDYATRADEDLKGPMVPLGAADGSIVEAGLVEQAWDFVRRNIMPSAISMWPPHRLLGLPRGGDPRGGSERAGASRLQHRGDRHHARDLRRPARFQSPGRLPNTVTPEGMKSGMRYARNQTLVNVMRDYRYVDARGMGVRD